MALLLTSLLALSATIAPARLTLTSTAFDQAIVGQVARPQEAPKRWRVRAKPVIPPDPPRAWGSEIVWLGFGLESALFRSKTLAEDMSITPQQADAPNAFVRETVLLFAGTGTIEVRPLPWLGIVGSLAYFFTPRFFSVSVETDGKVETKLRYAHGGELLGMARFYLRLSQRFDLFASAGPAFVVAHFRDSFGFGLGGMAQLGLSVSTRGFPEARLGGFIRYAPTRSSAGDDLDLNITGAGLMADVAFGVF
jgi:hypothetical protein